MDFKAILSRIEAQVAEQGTTARAVSLKAGMSGDAIRNWQRSLRSTGRISGMNARSIAQVAKALNVTTEWLVSGGDSEPAQAPRAFREPDVAPLRQDTPTLESSLLAAAPLLAKGARHIQIFVSHSDFPGFAILRGDLLVIGTPHRQRDGDLVVATLANLDNGESTTVLRQRIGDQVVPIFSAAPADESGLSCGILGTVVAVMRGAGVAEVLA